MSGTNSVTKRILGCGKEAARKQEGSRGRNVGADKSVLPPWEAARANVSPLRQAELALISRREPVPAAFRPGPGVDEALSALEKKESKYSRRSGRTRWPFDGQPRHWPEEVLVPFPLSLPFSFSLLAFSFLRFHCIAIPLNMIALKRTERFQMEIVLMSSRTTSRQRSRNFDLLDTNFALMCVLFTICNLHYLEHYFNVKIILLLTFNTHDNFMILYNIW